MTEQTHGVYRRLAVAEERAVRVERGAAWDDAVRTPPGSPHGSAAPTSITKDRATDDRKVAT